ncbi:MAG TPA: YaaL family protein, partial [Clostridiales bacterium]|nr:YaaL family protein [Clostridiales bacterium]
EIYPVKKNLLKETTKKRMANTFQLFKKAAGEQTTIPYHGQEIDEDYILIQNIKDAKNEWLNADLNLQYVNETEFVEYYIYKLKAAQIKYEFFLKKAKERGLKIRIDTGIQ